MSILSSHTLQTMANEINKFHMWESHLRVYKDRGRWCLMLKKVYLFKVNRWRIWGSREEIEEAREWLKRHSSLSSWR